MKERFKDNLILYAIFVATIIIGLVIIIWSSKGKQEYQVKQYFEQFRPVLEERNAKNIPTFEGTKPTLFEDQEGNWILFCYGKDFEKGMGLYYSQDGKEHPDLGHEFWKKPIEVRSANLDGNWYVFKIVEK